ncbi:hypothetical protein [Nocardia jejuensis]|uniref:hypothetical protein n=1 Tax=Nocardia jejuensis TaxID=328049 RepID=UPI0012FC2F73|nr:hypothetical protein [Nocardia jejuensis]
MIAHPHLATLYSCTLNCVLYEKDSGPQEAASEPSESSPEDRTWREYYAHHLITQLSADFAQLTECAEWARQEHDQGDLPVETTASESVEAERFWRCAMDIANTAIAFVEQAGAVTDDKARRVLLAGSHHIQISNAVAAVPGAPSQPAVDFVDELNRVEREESGD